MVCRDFRDRQPFQLNCRQRYNTVTCQLVSDRWLASGNFTFAAAPRASLQHALNECSERHVHLVESYTL